MVGRRRAQPDPLTATPGSHTGSCRPGTRPPAATSTWRCCWNAPEGSYLGIKPSLVAVASGLRVALY